MYAIKPKLCRRKFTHTNIVEYSLQNEVLLSLRIPEEMICFSFQHNMYAALFLTDFGCLLYRSCTVFLYKKVPKTCFDDAFVKKKLHTWSLFLFLESCCLSLSFWLIWQTSQAHDEGRNFLLHFWITVAGYFK